MSRNGLAATLRTGADVSYQGHRKVKFTASGSLAERIMEGREEKETDDND